MGLFKGLFGKKQPAPVQQPNKLLADIRASTEWIYVAMNSSGYMVDFTVESLKEIDRFLMNKTNRTEFYPKTGVQFYFQ